MQWQRALGTMVLIAAVFVLGLVVGLHWPAATAQAQQGSGIAEFRLSNGVVCYTFGGGSGFSCVHAPGLAPAGQP
jgi:fucose permease